MNDELWTKVSTLVRAEMEARIALDEAAERHEQEIMDLQSRQREEIDALRKARGIARAALCNAMSSMTEVV